MQENLIDQLQFDSAGLAPAVVQDGESLQVLMIGFMNREALRHTLETGKVTFWSRSRQELWTKGATSGMFLELQAVRVNCETNSLLVIARPHGPTCHTGHESCYYREATETGWREIAPVIVSPEELYRK